MAYSDQKFFTRVQRLSIPLSTVTATASSTANAVADVFPRTAAFTRRTAIKSIKVIVGTAPAANFNNLAFQFLNGTTTFAVATVGTNTANTQIDATSISTFTHRGTNTSPTSSTELAVPLGTVTNPALQASVITLGTTPGAVFAVGDRLKVNFTGTATASGHSGGSHEIVIEVQELSQAGT